MSEFSRLRHVTWLVVWFSLGMLLLQQSVDAWLLAAPAVIWAVKLLPLLMFVPGMLRDRLRSYIWLCFICLGYFMVLVQRIFAAPDSALVIIGLVANVLLFTSAMLYVRWRARELRASAASDNNSGV